MTSAVARLLVGSSAFFLGAAIAGGREPSRGIVVEDTSAGSSGAKAGLGPGDAIVSWVRPPSPSNPREAHGSLASPFDLRGLEIEQGPRGDVRLQVARGGRSFQVVVTRGDWGIQARPRMRDTVRARYAEGKAALKAGQTEKAATAWRLAAEAAQRGRAGDVAAWLWLKRAEALAEARRWDDAQASFEAALGLARQHRLESALPWLLEARARAYQRQGDLARAEAAYQEALSLLEKASPGSLAVAAVLAGCGVVVDLRGDFARAEEIQRRALSIREAAAPDSAELATTLMNVGNAVRNRGDLAAAEELHRRSVALMERLVPDSAPLAASLNNLAVTLARRGDLDAAQAGFERCLAIHEKSAPGGLPYALALFNLGNVAFTRGDLPTAQGFYERARAIRERLAPGSMEALEVYINLGSVAAIRGHFVDAEAFFRKALVLFEQRTPEGPAVAMLLNNLGNVAYDRGDTATAEEFLRRSLAIVEKRSPDSLDVAVKLSNLANVLKDRGDFAAAAAMHERALEIRERLNPGGAEAAISYYSLGDLALAQDDVTGAERSHRKALAIRERLLPGTLDLASSLHSLGDIAEKRGDLAGAEAVFTRALEIRQRLVPGSRTLAETLHNRGVVQRGKGDLRRAADDFLHAIEALEAQRGRLGGSEEVRSAFAARYAGFYHDYIEVLLELQEPEGAFHVLERSRARSLLAMLAERDLLLAADVPAELERERRLADTEYDRTQTAIGGLDPAKAADRIEALLARLRELRDRRAEIAERIRAASPRFASLQYPQPLALRGAREALDAGTALLAYSVGKEASVLFVVLPSSSPVATGLATLRLAVGAKALREQVEALRSLLQRRTATPPEPLLERARALYDTLIRPAESLIAGSERLLIAADGPLHTLPFGALVRAPRAASKDAQPQYLADWKPLHSVVSATVYAELRKSRRAQSASPKVLLAAFGNPRYPDLSAEGAAPALRSELRSALRRARELGPLPSTGDEVEVITRLYPDATAKYLGEDATEEKVKALGKDVRLVHLACHGLFDEAFPLNSALALTIPDPPGEGRDNGLLQAWEIFERVRLDADLVTLSACDTGLGIEMGGEGLVGLTRAFQYAGARSVLASLWSVSDQSTAELMKRFYGYLKAGEPKDRALRAAQLDLVRAGGALAHPFHWAAFQLNGDWK